MSMKKETVLEGFYATGDYECFCFGKHNEPAEYHAAALQAAKAELPPNDTMTESECLVAWEGWDDWDNSVRVYPFSLLPEESRGRRGTWKISVEFIPDE